MEGECLSGETPGNGVMPEPSQLVPNTVPCPELQSVLRHAFCHQRTSRDWGPAWAAAAGGYRGLPRHSAALRLGEADGA